MALSKNKIKLINSLQRKKYRDELGLFVAEGYKLMQQLFEADFRFHTLIATENQIKNYTHINCEKVTANYEEIKKASSLKTPQEVLAICYIPESNQMPEANELVIALDDVQDPGNLGTIIRLASWFGIKHLVCSEHTADCYNPKVIQATMGAIAHVNIHYTNLKSYLDNALKNQIPVYGTFLDGKIIYKEALKPEGIVVMGNEGNGISAEIASLIDHRLFIPSFASAGQNVESLNVSMATAIICSEFMRNKV